MPLSARAKVASSSHTTQVLLERYQPTTICLQSAILCLQPEPYVSQVLLKGDCAFKMNDPDKDCCCLLPALR